ncbi:MAG: hypothetical protein VX519_12300 [Myxococcota bacterium]|nr:hypothetical protein [Myxococcota bacterium]
MQVVAQADSHVQLRACQRDALLVDMGLDFVFRAEEWSYLRAEGVVLDVHMGGTAQQVDADLFFLEYGVGS